MKKDHPINDLLEISLEKVTKMVDTSKIVGQPIVLDNQKYIIPISKVTFGYGAGGTQIPKKIKKDKKRKKEKMEFDSEIAMEPFYMQNEEENLPFGGGSGGGITITPQAFFIIDEDRIEMKSVEQKSPGLDKVLEFLTRFIKKDTGAK